jgi:O-antigen biosynthesis protein WbqP
VIVSLPRSVKRAFDIALALLLIPAALPVLIACAVAIRLDSRGPVLHISRRVGRDNALFAMPKFRTMPLGTPQVATHLLTDATTRLTGTGRFLRRTSLDELPQLWSVLRGDMSFVGPRPALFNQEDLVSLRTAAGVHTLRPGITGWAQINGRDEIPIARKVELDADYLQNKSFLFDLKILFWTVWKAIRADGVLH